MEESGFDLAPQDIQKDFPQYDALVEDMMKVNRKLVRYRQQLKQIVDGK